MKKLADKNGIELFVPELKYCGDNAAMVGSQGYYEYLDGKIASLISFNIKSRSLAMYTFGN